MSEEGEKRIIERLKELLGEEEVEYALQCECRNAYLAGVADRLRYTERVLNETQYKEVFELLKQLGPDRYETEMLRRMGKNIDSVEEARKFWR